MNIIGISGLAGSGKDTVANILRTDTAYINISLADPLKRVARKIFAFSEEQLWGPSQFRNAPDKRYPRRHDWVTAISRRELRIDGTLFNNNSLYNCACCGQSGQSKIVHKDIEARDIEWKIDDSECEPCYLTPRFALQKLGTEFGRACYPNVWVEKTMQTAREILSRGDIGYLPTIGTFELVNTGFPARGVSIPDVRFKNEIEGIRAGGGKVIRVIRPGAGLAGAAGLHPSETEQMGITDADFDWVIVNDGSLDDLREKVSVMINAFTV